MKSRSSAGGIVAAIFIVLAIVVSFAWSRSTEKTVTITVTRLDDQATSKGHQYLVFTPQGVYKDADSTWFLKFNSSDLFNELQVHHTYRCKTTGARIPLISSYRNLLRCTPVSA